MQNTEGLVGLAKNGTDLYSAVQKAQAAQAARNTANKAPMATAGKPSASDFSPEQNGDLTTAGSDTANASGVAGASLADAGGDASALGAADMADSGLADDASMFASRGGVAGRRGYDDGGTPYQTSGQLDIPDDPNSRNLAVAGPQPAAQSSSSQDMNDIAKLAGAAAEAYGSYALLAAAKRGGRIKRAGGGLAGRTGYDDGGAPADDATMPDDMFSQASADATADTGAPQPGVAPAASPSSPTDRNSLLDKLKSGAKSAGLDKAETLVPLLTALGAMGTAPTKHFGVAASAGALAGAQSYYPAQEAAKGTTAQDIANQKAQYQLDLLRAVPRSTSAPTASPKVPSFSGYAGTDPSSISSYAQRTFNVPDVWTPDEQRQLKNNQAYSLAGLPNQLQTLKTAHDAGIGTLRASAAAGASADYDAMYTVANADPGNALSRLQTINPPAATNIARIGEQNGLSADKRDQLARAYAAKVGSEVYQFSGRSQSTGKDGIARDNQGQPLLGSIPEGPSREQYIENLKFLAGRQDVGSNYRPSVAENVGPTGVAAIATPPVQVPGAGGTVGQPTTPNQAAPAGNAPRVPPRAAAPAPSKYDFSAAPDKPTFIGNPRAVLSEDQKKTSDLYSAAEASLRDEASSLPATQQELVMSKRALNLLNNTKVGPGTAAMSAIQTTLGNMTGSEFTSWVDSTPGARDTLSKLLGANALDTTLSDLRSKGAQVRLGQGESNLILNKLSASPEMNRSAIRSLLNWQVQQAEYEGDRQNAIQTYLDQGKDARQFGNFYANKKPLTSALSTTPDTGAVLPANRPGQGSAPVTATGRDGTKFVLQGNQWVKQ
jgi:hypothetical protein